MKSVDRCPTCHRRNTRGVAANARYWLLLHAMADGLKPQGVSYSADTWHTYCKSRWIGCDDVTLPNGKVIPQPRSSAMLDVAEFADYMTAAESWAGEHGVWLADIQGAA